MPTRDSYEPGRPCWVDLGTTDPAAAHAFYGELFGWTAEVDQRPEAGGYAQLANDGRVVAGVGPLFAEGMPPAWTTYVASDDVDAIAVKVVAHGGAVLSEPFDVLDAGRMGVVADPGGAVFGVWQAKSHIGASLVNEPGSWSWNQLMTRDKAQAEAFYGAVFGWTFRSDPEWGEYWALGDGEIAGMSEMDASFPAEVPAHWQTAFQSADADATAAQAVDLGATTAVPMHDMGPGGRMGALVDPQGAVFGILSVPSQT